MSDYDKMKEAAKLLIECLAHKGPQPIAADLLEAAETIRNLHGHTFFRVNGVMWELSWTHSNTLPGRSAWTLDIADSADQPITSEDLQ